MAWTLNSIRIFVQKDSEDAKQIISRLQPVANNTVFHIFGYEKPVRKLTAYIVGLTDKASLEGLTQTGSTYALVSPEGSEGSYYVNTVSTDRIRTICQTLRPDLDSDAPVYSVEIELY